LAEGGRAWKVTDMSIECLGSASRSAMKRVEIRLFVHDVMG
jgi:hypothetical protein